MRPRTCWAGHPFSFAAALVIIAVWGFTGSIFKFSDTWQLIINTGTTIVTFLIREGKPDTDVPELEAVKDKRKGGEHGGQSHRSARSVR